MTRRMSSSIRMIEAVIFTGLGIGILWPWNAFISAQSYMEARMPPSADWEAWCSTLFNGGSILSLILWLLLYESKPSSGKEAQRRTTFNADFVWVLSSLGLYLTVFVMTMLGVLWVPSQTSDIDWEWWFQIGTYTGVLACGMATSVASAGVVGIAASGTVTTKKRAETSISSSAVIGGMMNSVDDDDDDDDDFGISHYFSGQAMGGLIVAVGNWVTQFYDTRLVTRDTVKISGMTNSSISPTQDYHMEQPNHHEDLTNNVESMLRYDHVSWPIFWFFAMSCVVLVLCIMGYTFLAINATKEEGILEKYDDCELQSMENEADTVDDDVRPVIESTPLIVHETSTSLTHFDRYSYSYTHSDNDANCGTTRMVPPLPPTTKTYHSMAIHRHNEDLHSFDESVATTPTMHSFSMDSSSYDEEEDEDFCSFDQNYPSSSMRETMAVWNTVAQPTLTLLVTYFVTLLLFPVWTSKITSAIPVDNDDRIHEGDSWYYFKRYYIDMYSPWTFVVFNLGDLLGRIGASWFPISDEYLLPMSLVRLVFLGLFCFCPTSMSDNDCTFNYHDVHVESMTPLIHGVLVDLYSWTIQLLMALSNGYLTTMAFEVAPSLLRRRPEMKKSQFITASTMMNLSLALGLWCGSASSFAYVEMVRSLLGKPSQCG